MYISSESLRELLKNDKKNDGNKKATRKQTEIAEKLLKTLQNVESKRKNRSSLHLSKIKSKSFTDFYHKNGLIVIPGSNHHDDDSRRFYLPEIPSYLKKDLAYIESIYMKIVKARKLCEGYFNKLQKEKSDFTIVTSTLYLDLLPLSFGKFVSEYVQMSPLSKSRNIESLNTDIDSSRLNFNEWINLFSKVFTQVLICITLLEKNGTISLGYFDKLINLFSRKFKNSLTSIHSDYYASTETDDNLADINSTDVMNELKRSNSQPNQSVDLFDSLSFEVAKIRSSSVQDLRKVSQTTFKPGMLSHKPSKKLFCDVYSLEKISDDARKRKSLKNKHLKSKSLRTISKRSKSTENNQFQDVFDNVKLLRREYHQTQSGLKVLNDNVNSSIVFTHQICSGSKTEDDNFLNLSKESKKRCRSIAVSQLFSLCEQIIGKQIRKYLQKWKLEIKFIITMDIAKEYCRVKSINIIAAFLENFVNGAKKNALKFWKDYIIEEKLKIQNRAAAAISKVIRGYAVRNSIIRRMKNKAAVTIQCAIRMRLSKKCIENLRKQQMWNNSASKIQNMVKRLLSVYRAKKELVMRRQCRAIIKVQKVMRGQLCRKFYKVWKLKRLKELNDEKIRRREKSLLRKSIQDKRKQDEEKIIRRRTVRNEIREKLALQMEQKKKEEKVQRNRLIAVVEARSKHEMRLRSMEESINIDQTSGSETLETDPIKTLSSPTMLFKECIDKNQTLFNKLRFHSRRNSVQFIPENISEICDQEKKMSSHNNSNRRNSCPSPIPRTGSSTTPNRRKSILSSIKESQNLVCSHQKESIKAAFSTDQIRLLYRIISEICVNSIIELAAISVLKPFVLSQGLYEINLTIDKTKQQMDDVHILSKASIRTEIKELNNSLGQDEAIKSVVMPTNNYIVNVPSKQIIEDNINVSPHNDAIEENNICRSDESLETDERIYKSISNSNPWSECFHSFAGPQTNDDDENGEVFSDFPVLYEPQNISNIIEAEPDVCINKVSDSNLTNNNNLSDAIELKADFQLTSNVSEISFIDHNYDKYEEIIFDECDNFELPSKINSSLQTMDDESSVLLIPISNSINPITEDIVTDVIESTEISEIMSEIKVQSRPSTIDGNKVQEDSLQSSSYRESTPRSIKDIKSFASSHETSKIVTEENNDTILYENDAKLIESRMDFVKNVVEFEVDIKRIEDINVQSHPKAEQQQESQIRQNVELSDGTEARIHENLNTTLNEFELEQRQEINNRIKRLEEMEIRIKEKEEYMILMARQTEEKHLAVIQSLRLMEEKHQKQLEEAESKLKNKELLNQLKLSESELINKVDSAELNKNVPNHSSIDDITISSKNLEKIVVNSEEWVQLNDNNQNTPYWYCIQSHAVQWNKPGPERIDMNEPSYKNSTDIESSDAGYESGGALTDYSEGNYESGGERTGSEIGNEDEWHEYWDEQAQAKYWFNHSTGEATWTLPVGFNGSLSDITMDQLTMNESLSSDFDSFKDAQEDWISFLDEATGQEYWYNKRTGQTSWA